MKENGYKDHDVEVYNFYSPLQTRDDTSRARFLDNLDKTLKELADVNKPKLNDNEENGRYTLRKHLPVVLRLSYDIPFPDVREYCARILQELEVRAKHLVYHQNVKPNRPELIIVSCGKSMLFVCSLIY